VATDEELLLAWRAGDSQAAGALFERHFEGLYRFFRNKAPAACDDLVQATFLGCFESKVRFRAECSFRTFLFAIARNQLLTWLSKCKTGPGVAFPEDSPAEDCPSPSSALQQRREQRLILAALRRLPLDAQILLELFYWENLTGPELAEIIEVPEGTVRTRLRKARQLLEREIRVLGRDGAVVKSTLTNLDGWAASIRVVRDASS